MSTIQTLFQGSIPAPAEFPRAPIVEAPAGEPTCAGSNCGLPLNKRTNGANQMVYDCIEVGGAKFHDMRCCSEQQKVQYQQETKARSEQRERDLKSHDARVRAERIEKTAAQLAFLKSPEGKAQVAALGFPYAFALEFVQRTLTSLHGNGPAPRLQFMEDTITTNPRAGRTNHT